MFRCATLLATLAVASAFIAPPASADPEAEPVVDTAEAAPAPPEGAPPPVEPPVELVESSPPATTKSPDGWTLTVSGKDETQRNITGIYIDRGAGRAQVPRIGRMSGECDQSELGVGGQQRVMRQDAHRIADRARHRQRRRR